MMYENYFIPKVKICGITNLEDALTAAFLGADAVGFVFAPSPRLVDASCAKEIILKLPPFIASVGVFMNQSAEFVSDTVKRAGLDFVQLHGKEDTQFAKSLNVPIIKRIDVSTDVGTKDIENFMSMYPAKGFILDPGCGHGNTFLWHRFIGFKQIHPMIVAGGLNPENVRMAVSIIKPYGVDVSSGVESSLGKKDPVMMKKFIKEAKWISE